MLAFAQLLAPPTAHVKLTAGPGTPVTFAVAVLVPAATLISVSPFVVNVTRASPWASVAAVVALSVPREAEKLTGMFASSRPPVPTTVAITLTVAPALFETVDGFARTVTVSTAALPTEISTTLLLVAVVVGVVVPLPGVLGVLGVVVVLPPAPPDVARTSATPESLPAKNVVVATPFRVCASTGSRRPSVVVK